MNKQDLKNKVSKLGYLYSIEDVEGGVLIYNKQFKTNTFIPDETIQELDMRSILSQSPIKRVLCSLESEKTNIALNCLEVAIPYQAGLMFSLSSK